MASKRLHNGEGSPDAVKRLRRVMSLEEKIKVLDELATGKNNCAVARQFGVNESTIRSIKSCEQAIRISVDGARRLSVNKPYIPHEPNVEKVDKELYLWVENESHKSMPACTHSISNKSGLIYQNCAECLGTNPEHFLGKTEWLENCERPNNPQNGEAGHTLPDHEAALRYSDELEKFIQEKGYSPDQVFNADETGLFWKRIPHHTLLSTEATPAETFKSMMDRLSLLFCTNASGDFIVKPMLLYRIRHPRSLKGKNMNHLPVFWRSNKQACITRSVFLDWFYNCFVHEVERYLRDKNLEFKVLLILDSSPCHSEELQLSHPNIEVVFLPPNTSSLLQPMEQGILRTVQAYYTRYTLDHIADLLESKPELSLRDAWDGFSIANSLAVLKKSIDTLKQSTLNAAWRKIWADIVTYSDDLPSLEDDIMKILASAKRLPCDGKTSLEFNEVADLLDSHGQELTEEDLQELVSLSSDDEDDSAPITKITSESLNELMDLASKLTAKAVEIDPFLERSLHFSQIVNSALEPYVELQKDVQIRASQPSLHAFYESVKNEAL